MTKSSDDSGKITAELPAVALEETPAVADTAAEPGDNDVADVADEVAEGVGDSRATRDLAPAFLEEFGEAEESGEYEIADAGDSLESETGPSAEMSAPVAPAHIESEDTPDTPSEVSTPASTRSKVIEARAAASTRVVETVQEPSSAGSVTRRPLVAPIARALRMVSGAVAGAIESSVTSPPWASVSLSAASSAYSSLPLTTAGTAPRSNRPSGPSRSPADAGSGTGFMSTTMCNGT